MEENTIMEEEIYSYYIDRTPLQNILQIPSIDLSFVDIELLSSANSTNINITPILQVEENVQSTEEPIVTNEILPNTNDDTKQKKDFSKIIQLINQKIKNKCREYHFRPFKIDGVYCYIVLYLKERILTIESINIKCNFNDNHIIPYVLYHRKYKSIDKMVLLIYDITTKYKIINGDLLSPTDYHDMKIEELLLPYNEDEKCCVCFENTTDNTSCGHYICFSCRDKCIIQKKKDCPMCRSKNVLTMYSNSIQLINNIDYSELYTLFSERIYYRNNRISDERSSSDEESESESDEESDSESGSDEESELDDNVEEIPIINLREVGLYSDSDPE